MMELTKSLADAIQEEISRVRELQKKYDSLLDNVGNYSFLLMESAIVLSIKALAENNPLKSLILYHQLQQFKE